jgi:8-hydroxy-5-deazaflavin:NADPH oxidoreductase
MNIAVLGTGMVGRALAGRLAGLGHDVVIGTRDVEHTLARTEPDAIGAPPYAEWQRAIPGVRLVQFPEAGAHGELVVNATASATGLSPLEAVGDAQADVIRVPLADGTLVARPPAGSLYETATA